MISYIIYHIFSDTSEKNSKPVYSNIGKGRLTERLLAEGLLTPQMLRELQSEWIQSTKKKK